jgi:protein-S-isoprenylcysteine O-methyltransferase Ste14
VERPAGVGFGEIVGAAIALLGAGIALWCIATFAATGRGTPAPFDPPRRLVARGPYRYVRNPMYLGAVLALGGAALVYRSPLLAAYVVAFFVACHLVVLLYEEPALRRRFGRAYADYCRRVPRWRVSCSAVQGWE